MNFEDAVFLLQLAVFLIVFFAMLVNLVRLGELFELKYTIVIFIVGTLSWGIGLVVSIYGYSYSLYGILFNLEIWLFYLMVLFMFLFIILHLASKVIGKGAAYNAKKQQSLI